VRRLYRSRFYMRALETPIEPSLFIFAGALFRSELADEGECRGHMAVIGYRFPAMTQKLSKVTNSTTQLTGAALFRETRQRDPRASFH